MKPLAALIDPTPRASRAWVWLQFVIGWLPVWVMYTFLILVAHGGPVVRAAVHGGRAIAAAALLGPLVLKLVDRLPWPRRVSTSFVLTHLAAAVVFSAAWVALTGLIETLFSWQLYRYVTAGLGPFLVLGLWLYVVVTGILYAVRATARAGRAEAAAVESQLAALRSQLNPHFLFNALHTVVQLIPVDPVRASDAAEALASLLRTALEEDRDLVSVREECAFVERYLALEHIRFGDRLRVRFDVDPAALEVPVPAFALQTLVENAVRHGAAPHVDATQIAISARRAGDALLLTVTDTGVGLRGSASALETGTGLNRLRARLDALFGDRARLELTWASGPGFSASVVVPISLTTPTEMTPPLRIRALIADDEPVARAGLRRMLSGCDWIDVVGDAINGLDAVQAINTQQPDLVFLDIQMPGLIGTEVLARIQHQPVVVFTTAYAQHAVTAFELGAVDYLLKPFGATRLATTLERVRTALGEPASQNALERIGDVFGTGPMTRLFVRVGGAIVPVPVLSVIWFEADGDYVTAHTERGRHVLTVSLGQLEARLDPKRFVRIHRAHIVNLDAVVAFRRHGKGGMTAEVRGGVQLAVSRSKAQELRKLGV